jgi:hypothetical protein
VVSKFIIIIITNSPGKSGAEKSDAGMRIIAEKPGLWQAAPGAEGLGLAALDKKFFNKRLHNY